MAGQTLVLTEFSNNGNSKTSTLAAHTAIKPVLAIETRKVPTGAQTVYEYAIRLISATLDADSLPIVERVSFSVVVRMPVAGATADRDAMLVAIRDIVAGDEFGNSVATQAWNS
jgi:hypothetical protein